MVECDEDGMRIEGEGVYGSDYFYNKRAQQLCHTKPIKLHACVIARHGNNGMTVSLSAQVTLQRCTIEDNANYGIERFTGSLVTLQKCVLRGNGIAALSKSFEEVHDNSKTHYSILPE
uniref:Vetispiradiene synthase 1 n=1 Tax=Lygus hesperus TaxID=30085 RepID=A0A0A9YY57_LYGHE